MSETPQQAAPLRLLPYTQSDIVLIKAITPLHPGVGRGGGIVDLPVQRDNLNFPLLFASSLKGSLKTLFWKRNQSNARELAQLLFGRDPDREISGIKEDFAAPIAVLDAFLLTLPARSLKGVYAHITSPLILGRFHSYLELTKGNAKADALRNKVRSCLDKAREFLARGRGVALVTEEGRENFELKLDGATRLVINEELFLQPHLYNNLADIASQILGVEEQHRLIVLNDDDMLATADKCLLRSYRVRLKREVKTVQTGGLWSEEHIPASTIFFSTILYSKLDEKLLSERTDGLKKLSEDAEVKAFFRQGLNETDGYLIIGGDETVGRGIVKLEWLA